MGTVIGTVVISYAENNNSTKNPVEAQHELANGTLP